jgi:cyclic beta-1,2-glucan synthetase
MELRALAVTPADAAVFQEFAGHLLYPTPVLQASQDELQRNQGSQPLLWSQGISGDWPILLASIDSEDGIPTLRQLFAAHHYWRRRGMMVDLVVVNEHPSGYTQEIEEQMLDAMYASNEPDALDSPGGVFFRRGDQLDPAVRLMLRATARVHVGCDGRTLARILETLPPASPVGAPHAVGASRPTDAAVIAPEAHRADTPPESPAQSVLAFDNGIGGMTSEGAYQIRVVGDSIPPAPWANVIANERGGFLVSERGAGTVWAGSSYFFRLTPWHNDPVSDPPGDTIYLRDDASGELWSATPAPVRSDLPYTVVHGQGTSVFTHARDGIATRLTLGLADDAAVKLSLLHITNESSTPRRLTVTAYTEWTLGALREHTQH